jgi:flagellar L-ring protein FlgH
MNARTFMKFGLGFTTFLCAIATAESLYNENTYRSLTSDHKAYRIGDLLTIQVFENASAATTADTATRRKNSIAADLSHGGLSTSQVGVTTSGDFDGGGRTQRTNKFLTTLTVVVTEVLPNGDLTVEGEQLLTLNDEQQRVSLQGRVRPFDITDGNVVLSNRLADARITYIGEGDLSERQKRSWWRKFIDWMGL